MSATVASASNDDARRAVRDRRLRPRGGRRQADVDRLVAAVPKFTCAACGESASKVTDSRPLLGHAEEVYRRTRACLWCGHVFRTEERITYASGDAGRVET